ncbi:MAG: ABC transporter permease [Rickettsiales bacterium]|nr:ABC transporter permease [Rickettsiales bacterium]
MSIIFITLEQSLLLLPLVLGIYLSYTVAKVTDLTVDGTFVLGAVVFARLITRSYPLSISVLGAIFLGAIFGVLVSLIQYKDKITPLIAGILMVLILQSINLQILGRPNVSVYGYDNVVQFFDSYGDYANVIVSFIVSIIAIGIMFILLKTNLGLILRGFGENRILLHKLGKNVELYRIFALALSNAMAAGCGAITAQIYGYADVSMGYGVALTAIGAVIIGSQIIKFCIGNYVYMPALELIGAFLGTCIYFAIINTFLAMGLDPINLKLVLGILLIIFLRMFGEKNHG